MIIFKDLFGQEGEEALAFVFEDLAFYLFLESHSYKYSFYIAFT